MIEPMQNFFMMCVVMKAGRPHMTSYELFNFSDIKNYPATQFWGSFLGVILWSFFIWSFFLSLNLCLDKIFIIEYYLSINCN